ncbi:hypothetical protein GPX89_22390 [Nocardia sp. ET3-3]|uniref:Uncharacterized protein n=1 Tax=Nocardia terrae TaxID=2675851 RepID=A0A7K1V0C7_9NOCA|nr:hypothetical protein [Nocardia terrae]MVU79981.1 hypothetical protein [Nocardia terrae]
MATENGGYQDKRITADATGITVRAYYFPTASAKRIPYESIRSVHRYPMGGWSGRGRGWGTSDPRYWFSLDVSRPRKSVGFVLDLGRRVHPVLTPDDPDAFESTLRTHNLDIQHHESARDIARGLG